MIGQGRVLIVDDEPKLVRLVKEILLATGYEVITAGTGQQAIEATALEQPDLVLLDIMWRVACASFRISPSSC
jgi:DNA-binding response OmpR family regulator